MMTQESTLASYSIFDLAKMLNAEIKGNAELSIQNIAPIADAIAGDITYLIGGHYRKYLASTKASAVILSATDAADCPITALIVKNPELAFAKIATLFEHKAKYPNGVHPRAVIGENCRIAPTAVIGANAVIEDNVTIGENTIIMPNSFIGMGTTIGANSRINSNVSIYHNCVIGNHVILHSGCVIGADGFGFAQDNGHWIKIPQLGKVIIEDYVEVGANTAIDRGALKNTVIHKGVKIDNCVQIGHNVELGENTIIAGCAGIAGSTTIGANCMIGGGCRVNGHITITDGVVLTGSAGVLGSITEPGIYSSGIDARPHLEWGKTVVRIHQLGDMAKRVKKLEKVFEGTDE